MHSYHRSPKRQFLAPCVPNRMIGPIVVRSKHRLPGRNANSPGSPIVASFSNKARSPHCFGIRGSVPSFG
jgi:hypothetical protein